jgi:hypothetical protein
VAIRYRDEPFRYRKMSVRFRSAESPKELALSVFL